MQIFITKLNIKAKNILTNTISHSVTSIEGFLA